MRQKLGKKGWMEIKTDLEKAYDWLSLVFIRETLEDIGFRDATVQIHWSRISSARMQVL